MRPFISEKSYPLLSRSSAFAPLLAALFFVAVSSANAVVTLLGNPYTPSGANFSIYAIQGLDLSTGHGSGSPQVNRGLEFDDGLGVSYSQPNGNLTHFGLGLYSDAQHQTQTTGLRVQYNTLVDPFSLTLRLEDFDLGANDTFFKPDKVEPGILLLGANNTILANALPTDIWSALSVVPGGKGGKGFSDVWDLSFTQLFANLNLQNMPISGFVLYADRTRGERTPSDPYFLVSAGNGIPAIPEPPTYFAGIAAFVFALVFHVQQARKRKRLIVARNRLR
ncbi:MAG: hypothetical protein ACREIW_01330 [Chthoniobacterales bacterium]